jgi:hypothetical protein
MKRFLSFLKILNEMNLFRQYSSDSTLEPKQEKKEMTPNEKVVQAAYDALNGRVTLPTQSGFCLQHTRLIVERAHGLPSHGWYKWRTHIVERAPGDDTSPWARDMERSMRMQDFHIAAPLEGNRYLTEEQVAQAIPGDIVFRWDLYKTKAGTFVGHVGIIMPGGLIYENINPSSRPNSYKLGVNSLTPLKDFPMTLIARFDPAKSPQK